MVKAVAMVLKAVVPGIPKSARDRELLKEDLRWIGCHGFMGKPWGLRMEDLVVELLGEKDCEHYRQYRQLVVLFFLVFSKFLLDISSSRVKRWQTRFILS